MIHDNPYDEAAENNRDEDRRQAMQEGAEEAENERRQMRKFWPDWGDCRARSIIDEAEQDAAYEHGDPKRSDFLDNED